MGVPDCQVEWFRQEVIKGGRVVIRGEKHFRKMNLVTGCLRKKVAGI